MDFSLPRLFVLQANNSLPTTGTWADLSAKQFGVFKPDYTPATAGNVASQAYIYLAQGRPTPLPGVGVKHSDKIYLKNVIDWYKITAHSSVANQITEVDDFSIACGETATITIRVRSFYSDVAFYNGLTKSFTVTAPCCDCGDSPCEDIADADIEDMVDEFIAQINADTGINGIGQFVTASRVGSGASSKIWIEGKPLAAEPKTADRTNFPFQFDRVYFWVYAYKGSALTQDLIVADKCEHFATVTKLQNASYPTGSSAETKQMEIDFNSYDTHPIAKQIFKNINFNQGVQESEVVDGTYYDFYYLKFANPMRHEWNHTLPQDESVVICNPTSQNSGTIAVLTAFFGTPEDKTGNNATTTTTTTTS